QESTNRGRRYPAIDGARPALLSVDVPARTPLEPGPARGGKPARIALTLERRPDDDLAPVGRKLEVEARPERFVAEPELHHLWLDDDPPTLEERQEVARVFAPDVDSDAPGTLILEACEQADRVAVGGRMLVLRDEQRARQKRDSVLGIEQCDGEPAAARTGRLAHLLDLQAILDLLGRRRHRLRQPRVDARIGRPVGCHA